MTEQYIMPDCSMEPDCSKEVAVSVNNDFFVRRKTNHQKRVEQMHSRIQENSDSPNTPSKPTIPSRTIVLAQARLIFEEMFEMLEACGVSLWLKDSGMSSMCKEDFVLEDTFIPMESDGLDLPHIAKELADLSVVTTGMFSTFGIADAPILEEVDANNLAKFGPGGYLNK